jgi:hypothetical protein
MSAQAPIDWQQVEGRGGMGDAGNGGGVARYGRDTMPSNAGYNVYECASETPLDVRCRWLGVSFFYLYWVSFAST